MVSSSAQCVISSSYTGQFLALKELEGSTAAGGDVAHLIRKAELIHSSCGVAAADDRRGVRVRKRLGDRLGAFREDRVFEDAHRSVPHDRFCILYRIREQLYVSILIAGALVLMAFMRIICKSFIKVG